MAAKQRTEIIDGREWTITTLPPDPKTRPSAAKQRALFNALSSAEKSRYIRERVRKLKKCKRRKRRPPAS